MNDTRTLNTAGASYNYSYDAMYRLGGMTDSNNNAIVNNVSYNPANQLLTMSAAGDNETRTYNTLGQLTGLNNGSQNLTYTYPAGTNNGKISSRYDAVSGETVTYTYDSLNRLASATGNTWGDSYGFDGFGNLVSKTVTKGSAPTLSVAPDPNTNHLGGEDANGNAPGAVYEVENRMIQLGCQSCGGMQYAYDAQNKRNWSWAGGLDIWNNRNAYTLNYYSPAGQKLAAIQITLQPSTPPVLISTLVTSDKYFGGKRLAAEDRLGSVGDFYPWGEAKGSNNPQDTWSYGTYWRDSASGLDYADQRYYANSYGRFMTPDLYMASGGPADPRSWNRYTYTRGDPVNRYDPTGNCDQGTVPGPNGDGCVPDPTATGPDNGGAGGTGGGGDDPYGLAGTNCPGLTWAQVHHCQQLAAAHAPPGPYTYTNLGKDQAKMKVIGNDMSTLTSRLSSDPNCLNWLSKGGRFQGVGIVQGLLPGLFVTEGQISNADGSLDGITAVANPLPGESVLVNVGGAFFYGGNVPSANGTMPAIRANSLSGQLLVLLHELAHVNNTAGFSQNDLDSNINAANNDQVWQNCQKTITGK